MKKFPGIACIVICLALAWGLLCGAALGEEKQEGQFSFTERDMSGTYVTNILNDSRVDEENIIGGQIPGLFPADSRDWDQREEAVSVTVTLLSGDEALKDAFVFTNDFNHPLIKYNFNDRPLEGEATFRLEAESEHYRASLEFTARFVDLQKVKITQKTDTVEVELGEATNVCAMDFLRSLVETDPEIDSMLGDFPYEKENDPEGRYEFDGRSIILRKAGTYPQTVVFELGENTVPIPLQVSFVCKEPAVKPTAEPTPEPAPVEEKEEKPAAFSGKTKVNAICYGVQNNLLNVWFYLPGTLPDYVRASSSRYRIFLSPENKYEEIYPDAYSVELVSGDESLKNVLVFQPNTDAEGKKTLYLSLDLKKLSKPAEGVFKIRLESRNRYYESEFPVRVLDWNEKPLYELMNPTWKMSVAVSGSQRSRYWDSDITGSIIRNHFSEIASAWPDVDQTRVPGQVYFNLQGEDQEESVQIERYMGGETYEFLKAGEYTGQMYMDFGNVLLSEEITLTAEPYYIYGSGSVAPGTVQFYSVIDTEEGSGRSYTLSVEGEGVSIDDKGFLTVAADAAEGSRFVITATPSEKGQAVTFEGIIWNGAMGMCTFDTDDANGFRFPLLGGPFVGYQRSEKGWPISYTNAKRSDAVIVYPWTSSLDVFAESPETAAQEHSRYFNEIFTNMEIREQEEISLDGHPAFLALCTPKEKGETESGFGFVLYARNKALLVVQIYNEPLRTDAAIICPELTMNDLEKVAAMIRYNPAEANIALEDGAITVSGGTAVTAGKKLQLKADFANPEKVNQKNKNNGITWSVAGADGKEAPEGVTIDKKGTLTAPKGITEATKVTVTAAADYFGTGTSVEITVLPPADGITAEPAELTFYLGEEKTETVKALVSPEAVPPVGILWKAQKEGIVEIVPDDESGTAIVRALKAGTTGITVTEPGGKKANVKVTVAEPVTAVELKAGGKAVPGGTVTVTAALTPKKPGNPALEWTLDVGEEIATVSNGKVKISKTAPAGTVITVTCRALGAPQPVEAVLKIEVAEK